MPLGKQITDWLDTGTPLGNTVKYFKGVGGRANDIVSYIDRTIPDNPLEILLYVFIAPFALPMNILFAVDLFPKLIKKVGSDEAIDNISKNLAKSIRSATNHQAVREVLEVLGTLISEPVVSIFESYSERDDFDYKEFIRAFHGLVAAITLSGSLPGTVGEITSFGQIELLGKPINDLYFNLGLGFLGWQTLSPILNQGIALPAERDVNKKFRQTRFKTGEALQLFHRNKITYEEIVRLLQAEGWRDIDIPLIVEQSYNNFSDGQIFDYFEKALLNEAQVREYLRSNGWKSTDIDLIIKSQITERVGEAKSVSLSTARKALKLGTISEVQFSQFLTELGYTPEAIQLELSVLRFDLETENKTLSISQIRQAYNEGLITENEAIQGLLDLQYSQTDALTVFNTWKAAKQPRILRLNQSTITKAMVQGVLSADEALQKLQSIGYSMSDASLVIDTVSVKTGSKQRLPSVAQILQAMQAGIIPMSEAETRLAVHGFNATDTKLLIDLSNSENALKPSEQTILEAYQFDAINETEARQGLEKLGGSPDYIDTRILTYTNRKRTTRKAAPLAEIAKWFRNGLISEAQALDKVQDNGLSRENAGLFLQAIGLSPSRNLSASTIRDSLFYGITTPNEALDLLRKTGLSDTDADTALATMQAEIAHKTPKAAISALLDAARKQIISLEEFGKKLAAYRLGEDDIKTYTALAVYEPPQETIKLTKADILKAYRLGEMDKFTAITFLEGKGYSIEEGELLIRLERKDINDDSFAQLFLAGAITQEAAFVGLSTNGFADAEIIDWFNQLT